MRILFVVAFLAVFSCKTLDQQNSELASDLSDYGRELPPETQRLWDEYLESLAGVELQKECVPRHTKPTTEKARGLVVIYHGFTGCPIQFDNIARELAEKGYHTLLPLLPGNGRVPEIDFDEAKRLEEEFGKPISQIILDGDVNNFVKDRTEDIPDDIEAYLEFSRRITGIAKSFPGPRILSGLSLGGGLSLSTLIAGADMSEPGTMNVWERALFITPFFKAPGLQGNLSRFFDVIRLNFPFSFGPQCETGQIRDDFARRVGICDFDTVDVGALQRLGSFVTSKEQIEKVKVPVQVIGVANDNTSDNTAFLNAFDLLDPQMTEVCIFPDEVGHATFFEGDFLPLNEDYRSTLRSARETNLTPRITRFWAREIQDQAVEFLAEGFDENKGPFVLDPRPSTERNKKAKRCKLDLDIQKVYEENIEMCRRGFVEQGYCDSLDALVDFTCDSTIINPIDDSSDLKQFCDNVKRK